MRGLGISCSWAGERFTATFVALDRSASGTTLVDVKNHSSRRQDDLAQALADLRRDADGIVQRFAPDAVVVRAPDRPPAHVRPNVEAVRKRGLVDGVLIAAARETVERVRTLSGRDIGTVCASNKADADAEGEKLVGVVAAEAAAAALAALAP